MIHPETGQKTPWKGSFSEIVHKEMDFRSRNPALVEKNDWSLDIDGIESFIDQYNAQRMVAAGYLGFVELEGDPPASSGGMRRGAHGVVAAAVSGLAIYRELFSGKSKPVERAEAERRAVVCVECPLNKQGGLKEWFVEHVAKGITELYGIMSDLNLTTSRDKELGTCTACLCPTKAKVHVDLTMIQRHMKSEVIAKLDPKCWIINPVGS